MTGETDVITKISHHPVASTVSVLTGLIEAKGMKLFAVIDQSAEARQAGLALRETTLVIFGSPAAGTPVMQASPLSALDLPLKVLVWDDGGQTKVSYDAPAARRPPRHPSLPTLSPLSALDLPLKVLVWDDGGQTKVSYDAPAALAARHHLSAELAGRLAGIDARADGPARPNRPRRC